ncbi:MAG: hypothetical protein BWY15_01970 [Firmicutes bacterium ADurb.Bin193]|nr:MAG: hypothetical protein BWY15_01970 [Firmicutes bacterium ADurb.Bin193]
MMTSKEFLNQAYRIDERINSKIEQVRSLRDLATKATSVLSLVPNSGTRNVHRMEDIIAKMADIEAEVNSDVEHLLEIKRIVREIINDVDNVTYRTILELRYLCFKTWDEIAATMYYDYRYLLKIHDRALKAVDTKRHYKTNNKPAIM